ncbi:tRNA (adenosine(37)-N6)-dimethylallyltransferase MiaA [Ruminococcus sp.]|uniref:tRNA (adenosine(37)-N6)-dimethylallyltransferase MiaA n=1 Tax=Ruminococcus sp. TaxID=41978 RepID=UPI0025FF0AA6|nr:tRNA (adenosine(37)-N6)-dimethylallyltransferase MiaA [Ruminococcus sp.]MCI6616186.1 tRNA (adenosine(37)-N6)-dimethylallyltransferase MiaA [Ruminococcus sp.]
MKLKSNSAGCDILENSIKVVSIVGPTASGKTKLAVKLAKKFNGEIVSADSMQIYKGMQIATAKPTFDETEGIKHHLIDFVSPDETYSVAMFVKDASKCIADINSRGKLPFIVGGTGLYVDSLLNNITFNEEQRDEKLSLELRKIYEVQGIDTLLEMLSEFDIDSANRLKAERNPKRIIRAIEFYKTTGITITEQNEKSKLEKSPYRPIKIGLNFKDRAKLYERINKRVDLMLENGLVNEAKDVLSNKLSFTSVKAIGYKELLPYFNGEKTLDECVEKLKMETRRYAKRQITWFKRDLDINWLYADDYNSFEELLADAVEIIKKG